MSDFLAFSACKGRKPERILGRRLISRPDLVARLLRERHVARFLVAPAGFGKSSLAYEYADTVLSFQHVFWINAQSPCFLRDLDAGIISSRLRSIDSSSFLAVFEDVPFLDGDRVEAFSAVVDELLDFGHEVLVTCTPSCDAYAERHRDRMKLSACDLLLTDKELAGPHTGASRKALAGDASYGRIASVCWGSDDGSVLLGGMAHEELPGDIRLVAFVMFALQSGSWSDLEVFMPAARVRSALAFVAERYPQLGADARAERYETLPASPELVAAAFGRGLDGMARQSSFRDGSELVAGVADALVSRGEAERACLMMSTMATKASCAAWLARKAGDLVCSASLLPVHRLYEQVGRSKGEHRAILGAYEAWCLQLLGDGSAAVRLAQRIGFATKEAVLPRAVALTLLSSVGDGEMRAKAANALAMLLTSEGCAFAVGLGLPTASQDAFGIGGKPVPPWAAVAAVQLALERSVEEGACQWVRLPIESDAVALRAAALLVLNAASLRNGGDEASRSADCRAEELRSVAEFASRSIERSVAEGSPQGFDLLASRMSFALSRASECALLGIDFAPSHRVMTAARRVELCVAEQCQEYAKDRERAADRKAEFGATHPDALRFVRTRENVPAPTKVTPVLHVDLFGGLNVRIGDEPVDPLLLRRQKVKNLLAVMVLNKGREMSQDRLVSILWPGGDPDTARKNLYAIWSQLRRALTAPDGSHPYMIRERGGCRLDARLVESDITLFEETCRTLLFGKPNAEECERLLALVNERFSDDLMPSELNNDYLVRAREDCRMRLVDALASASTRLVGEGEVRGGLWFAREALRRDSTREDVYVALMEAQLAAGQRTAALESYFALRRYLAEELGIDPGAKTVRLYREIIEAEDIVDW